MYSHVFELEEEVFKVLANQKRLEIIQLLHRRELNVTEMIEMLGLRQANLSQHLTLLRQAKLVVVTKRGRESYYRLTDETIAKAVRLIYRFLQTQHNVEMPHDTANVFPIVIDPVCGMRLSASEAFDHLEDNGTFYYFCASGCKERFVVKLKSYRKNNQLANVQVNASELPMMTTGIVGVRPKSAER